MAFGLFQRELALAADDLRLAHPADREVFLCGFVGEAVSIMEFVGGFALVALLVLVASNRRLYAAAECRLQAVKKSGDRADDFS